MKNTKISKTMFSPQKKKKN